MHLSELTNKSISIMATFDCEFSVMTLDFEPELLFTGGFA